MEYVSEVADVVVGDVVVTSGIDGIYPEGLRHRPRRGGRARAAAPTSRSRVKPAVDFSSLEEVLVVLTPTPAREAAEGSRAVRAAGGRPGDRAGARAADDAGPVRRPRHRRRRPRARRGRLRRADVRAR